MNEKYKIRKDLSKKYNNTTVYRIEALRNFSDVKKGEVGGLICANSELSHDDNSWIYGDSVVIDSIIVDNSTIKNNSIIEDSSRIYDSIIDYSTIKNNSVIDNSIIDTSIIYNSIIDNSTIKKSRIENSNVNSSFENVELSRNSDFFEFTNIGKLNRTINYNFKTKQFNINNCFIGSIKELKIKLKEKYDESSNYHDYTQIIKMLEKTKRKKKENKKDKL